MSETLVTCPVAGGHRAVLGVDLEKSSGSMECWLPRYAISTIAAKKEKNNSDQIDKW